MIRRIVPALALAVAFTVPTTVGATDGYFAHGYGIKAKAMGGASTAVPTDAMGGAVNPAKMVFSGSRLDIGVDLFLPRRSSERTLNGFGLNGGAESDSLWFPVPEFGYNRMLNERLSFGITMYGNGGMNTDYPGGQLQCGPGAPPGNLLCGAEDLGVDMSQLVMAPTLAVKLGDRNAVGISALIGWQRFNMRGIQAFAQPGFTIDPSAVTNNGHDTSWGFGVRLGWMAQVTDQFSIGAAYAPKMNMGEFDKYRGLFAEEGDFDIPENFNIGIAVEPTPGVTAAFDYQRINYSGVKSVGNPSLAMAPFGADNGPGFGWRDVNVLKFGVSVKASRAITVLGGYNHTDNPIRPADVTINILAPGVVQDHLTLGAAFAVGGASELVVSYMHAFDNDVIGDTAPIFPGGGVERIQMYQNAFGIAWNYKF